jgi:putative ABC transport system permease protein
MSMTSQERAFRLLLRLYPRSFRERFGEELVAGLTRDRKRPRFHGKWGGCVFWGHTVSDALRTAVDLRWGDKRFTRRDVTMGTLVMDLRFALRSMWRNGRVSLLAALTLALGIGAITAILTVAKGVLLDPLPYREADHLALIWSEMPNSDYAHFPISGPELNDLRTRSHHFEEFASIWTTTGALVEDDEPETVRLGLVTWNFPSILGVEPVIGRTFESGDEGTSSNNVLIGEALWRRRFAGESSVLGKSVRIDGGWGFPGGTFTVVGVVPASFRLVMPSDAGVATDFELWVPFGNDLKAGPRGLYYLRTVGRLRQGSTLDEARQEIRAIGEQVGSEFAEYDATGRGFDVVSLKRDAVGRARPVILALLAGTGCLLLITCVNVANLLLSRAAQRREEILLRSALGASGRQIAAQLLAESLILASFGGVGGVLLGAAALRPILALAPGSLPRPDEIAIEPIVLAVGFGVSLLCGLLFGLAPVLASRRQTLYSAIRSASLGRGGFVGRGRGLLVVAELALAFVLSVSAVLCYRTLAELERVDLGFRPEGVLTMELTLPRQRYGSGIELENFTRELERRLQGVSGVVAAGAINQLPLSDLPNWSSPYRLRKVESEGVTHEADGRVVSPGYFRAVGARLVEGRFLEDGDDGASRHVVVVDEMLASRAWPGASPLGREIQIEVRTERGFVPVWAEVVGVIQHMRHHDPRFELREEFFVPFAQGARNQMGLAVLAAGDPSSLLEPVRAELAAIDKDLAVSNVRLLEDYVRDARSVQRFTMLLAAGFAGMALVLGCLGLYGVVSHAVSCRRREIGLRLALGSTAQGIVRWVLGQGVVLVAAGIGLGLVGALAAGRMLRGLLFGVGSSDPATLVFVLVVLVAVTVIASLIPARQATRIDPMAALRED